MSKLIIPNDIQAIFFDIGDTLRERVQDEQIQAKATQDFVALVQPKAKPHEFCAQLDQRYHDYQQWRQKTLIEVTEPELWTRWMLPDFPPDRIAPMAGRLTDLWRLRGGKGIWREDAPNVIRELHARGYVLGVISNTISSTETPSVLEEFNLTRLFAAVILSTTFGKRKPDPELFTEAAWRANVVPNRSAYVGDRPSRDVLGCKRAGFALSIVVAGEGLERDEDDEEDLVPDVVIHELSELLDIFLIASKE